MWLICVLVQAAASTIQLIFGQAKLRPGELQEWIRLAGSGFLTGHVQVPGRMWKEEGQGAVLQGADFPQKDGHHKHCI